MPVLREGLARSSVSGPTTAGGQFKYGNFKRGCLSLESGALEVGGLWGVAGWDLSLALGPPRYLVSLRANACWLDPWVTE